MIIIQVISMQLLMIIFFLFPLTMFKTLTTKCHCKKMSFAPQDFIRSHEKCSVFTEFYFRGRQFLSNLENYYIYDRSSPRNLKESSLGPLHILRYCNHSWFQVSNVTISGCWPGTPHLSGPLHSMCVTNTAFKWGSLWFKCLPCFPMYL